MEAYLDEGLPVAEMTRIEDALRADPREAHRLSLVITRRDSGVHSLGEIWRRHRLTCPGRDQLGSYLLRTLDRATMQFITQHLEIVGCRLCQANLEDLRDRMTQRTSAPPTSRRQKYFQSSAGLLPKK